MELTGHTILITGGATGIGLAFARQFLALGNEVIIAGRRQNKLNEAQLRYPRLHAIRSDVADPASVAALAADLKNRFPKLDVLMNNAGAFAVRNLADGAADPAELTSEIETNFMGMVRLTSSLVELITRNSGTIINVSSAVAFAPLTAAPIYSATKAAIHSYTCSLRFQLAEAGVRVLEIMPPLVSTDMVSDMPQGDFKMITADQLAEAAVRKMRKGETEIRVGLSNQMYWMSRLAPSFIAREMWKGSRASIPKLAGMAD